MWGSMYSINGHPLENPARGWALAGDTKPLSEFTRSLMSIGSPGRDGVVSGLPSTVAPVTISLSVETPKATLESLVALFGAEGVLTMTPSNGRFVAYEVASMTYRSVAAKADERVVATFVLRLPNAFWRAATTTTTPVALSSALVTAGVFDGLSAPVQDAVLRLKGSATSVRVTDSSGAWVAFPDVTSSQWARFDSASGRCFITTSDTWTGGSDVSGTVDFGGPRGVFEIAPVVDSTLARSGSLTITSGSRSAAVLEVRGRPAHAL